MKYRSHILLSLVFFLGVILTMLKATSDVAAPHLMFTLVNARHNYPAPWKSCYSKGCLEGRGKYEGMCKDGWGFDLFVGWFGIWFMWFVGLGFLGWVSFGLV